VIVFVSDLVFPGYMTPSYWPITLVINIYNSFDRVRKLPYTACIHEHVCDLFVFPCSRGSTEVFCKVCVAHLLSFFVCFALYVFVLFLAHLGYTNVYQFRVLN
jgi:hypothetical protein